MPQTVLLLPFAAFFVAACGLICVFGKQARGYGLCLLLGAALGLALMSGTNRRLDAVQRLYAGRTVFLRAEVESTSASFYDGVVNAVLLVKQADGQAASFRCEGVAIPECSAGEYIEGSFSLETPAENLRIDRYADGVALEAEYVSGFEHAGESSSFRAWTARLQSRWSAALRRSLSENVGGVMAAMVLGDRNALPSAMNSAYRAAGLSHVLVVSGMHVSILCGDAFRRRGDKKERSYASRRAHAVWSSLLALLLAGVTGFTPSVVRAAAAVWISSFGVWIFGSPDALTSLAAAGLLMSLANGYAVCDVGFELSFAAVLGTLAGAECTRRGRAAWAARAAKAAKAKKKAQQPALPPQRAPLWRRALAKGCDNLWETVCISVCASAGTFPVLVLRGLSASLYALVSSVAVLWLVDPLMYLGLGAALAGLVPLLQPLYYALAFAAGALTYILNAWAVMVAGWPGAQIYFETEYAALVCLLLIALCWLAARWRVRLRVSAAAVVFIAAASLGTSCLLDKGVAHVQLVGGSNTPAVVITQDENSVVLFRGGASVQRAVEQALANRGFSTVGLLIDMRMQPTTQCTLPAQQVLEVSQQNAYTTRDMVCGAITAESFRTKDGCAVLLDIAGHSFAALSGTVEQDEPLEVDWLLASPANPRAFEWQQMLTLSSNYRWLAAEAQPQPASRLVLRPGGGQRVRT